MPIAGWRCGWLLPLLVVGCGAGDAPPEPRDPPPQAPSADVVARVGDQVVRAQQVREYVANHGGTPLEALRALEDEALLLEEARRRGWEGAGVGTQARAEEQLLAQRVLLDIERAHPFDAPTPAEVQAYYAEHESEIVRDEQRECIQVLVQLPEGATTQQDDLARGYVEQTLERMRVEGVSEVWSSQPPEHQGLRVLSQYLPTATPTTEMPEDFRRAIYGLSAPGPAAAPVRSPSGWHAVAVTLIHAPIPADSARALEVARERLVNTRRRQALDERLRSLSERFPVSASRERIEAILPALGELLGPAT